MSVAGKAVPGDTSGSYVARLGDSFRQCGSALCLGLDPVPEFLPESFCGTLFDRVAGYYTEVLEVAKTQDTIPGAFKANIGYFHAMDQPRIGDFGGSRALCRILDLIRAEFPLVPIILDAKRGDIARSSTNYGREAFSCWQVDAVTVSPYMGQDSVLAVVEEAQRTGGLVYTLVATSNPGAVQFQSLELDSGGSVYQRIAETVADWHVSTGACGAVVGATRVEDLCAALGLFASGPVPVLIPGIGHQGGSVSDVLRAISCAGYPTELARVNVSSGITHPWRTAGAPADWREVVARSLADFQESLQ